MMITESTIRGLVEEKIEGTDMFLVSVRVLPSNLIKVFVDSVGGLNVKDCVAVSRHIEGSLDREKEDFELEVSSPGLSEPFQHPLQYKKNVGRGIKVTTADGESVKGELIEFEGESITVQPEKKKKKEQAEPVKILLTDIKEAKTVISFK
ncbi:MAG: ribosome assembly cofactor RimP [Flavobacteriales bacterium]|nr:ribosome assembly cofactor RimP [Flavobacteriales bacterium]